MLKIGVAGVGHLGQWHAQKYADLDKCELVGVFDQDMPRAQKIAAKNNCRAFDSYATLLSQVDAVDISTTTTAHYELAKEALLNGKHVLVEKPITAELVQADELCQIASDKGLKLQVGHIERFNPAVLSVCEQIHEPLFVESHRLAPFTPRGTEVPVVLDLMIHDIDLILDFIPSELISIQASGVSIFTSSTDIATARLEFANGAVANITASRASMKRERKLRFFQKDAYISLDFQNKKVSVIKKSADSLPILARMLSGDTSISPEDLVDVQDVDVSKFGSDALLTELESFVDCIINNTNPVVDGKAGARALQVAYEIMQKINNKILP